MGAPLELPEGYIPITVTVEEARRLVYILWYVAGTTEGVVDLIQSDPEQIPGPVQFIEGGADNLPTANMYNISAWISYVIRKINEATP